MVSGMTDYHIGGIQQIGAGVSDLPAAFRWYRQAFGLNIKIFEDDGEAALMLPYTGGSPQARRAVLAINLQGGGGLEIWQYRRRRPLPAAFEAQPGDLGILAARIKARDVGLAHERFRREGYQVLAPVQADPNGQPTFFVKDPFGLLFQVVSGEGWFLRDSQATGGVAGAMLGVAQFDRALELYQGVLGYDRLLYDRRGVFEDLAALPGGRQPLRRVLLEHSAPRRGAFSPILGPTRLELVQCLERSPRKIFAGRFWGDLGFIHLCFDVAGLDALKQRCREGGFPFTVDSADSSQAFSMKGASGRFAYVEDPDGGTLLEFVETYRLALLKKFGWYLDLRRPAAREAAAAPAATRPGFEPGAGPLRSAGLPDCIFRIIYSNIRNSAENPPVGRLTNSRYPAHSKAGLRSRRFAHGRPLPPHLSLLRQELCRGRGPFPAGL